MRVARSCQCHGRSVLVALSSLRERPRVSEPTSIAQLVLERGTYSLVA